MAFTRRLSVVSEIKTRAMSRLSQPCLREPAGSDGSGDGSGWRTNLVDPQFQDALRRRRNFRALRQSMTGHPQNAAFVSHERNLSTLRGRDFRIHKKIRKFFVPVQTQRLKAVAL